MAISRDVQLHRLSDIIADKQKTNFYGQVVVEFFSGDISLVRVRQDVKLDCIDDSQSNSSSQSTQ